MSVNCSNKIEFSFGANNVGFFSKTVTNTKIIFEKHIDKVLLRSHMLTVLIPLFCTNLIS